MTNPIQIPCLKIDQPIGQFYIGVMSHVDLLKISFVDQRSLDSELDDFIGIQRELSKDRVKKINQYVENVDATFPTSIIISIHDENCSWDEKTKTLTIHESKGRKLKEIAKILDGQHRVEGLKDYPQSKNFELSVTIFVEVDVATQANIFATVNLAQTKVNRSLVYDLFAYEKARSPQKSCHEITVALNNNEGSPFHNRIKRLGVATPGVQNETLTQAAVVEALLNFVSSKPTEDRNKFLRVLRIKLPSMQELRKYPFRAMWLNRKESDIAQILYNYFSAVTEKWPHSWSNTTKMGNILPRTNGFKALMRFLRPVYLELAQDDFSIVPSRENFGAYFEKVAMKDDDFNTEKFPPGSSGEAILFKVLMQSIEGAETGSV